MIKFCCQNFLSRKSGNFIIFYSDSRNKDTIIDYYPPRRQYSTSHSKKTGCYIQYCPWCGTKLPKELSDEWFDTLEREYGIISPIHDDREKVPPEFWTDEWWKKRGL